MQTSESCESPINRREWGVPGAWGYLVALGGAGLALAIRMAVDKQWSDRMPYALFFVAAILCIMLTDVWPAVLSIAGGLLLANWFFVPPRHALSLWGSEHLLPLCAYLLNLGIILAFGTWAKHSLRRERAKSAALRHRSEALEASEKRFQTLAEAAFEGILVSQNGRIVDCNDQVGELVGYKREELLGQQATSFIAAEHRQAVMQNIQAERAATYELELLCRDGSRRRVEAHGRPLNNSAGAGLRVSVVRDITEQKRSAEEMRQKTEELERLMDALPVAVWIAHDRECHRVTGNRPANELLGVKPGSNVAPTSEGAPKVNYFKSDGTEYLPSELPLQQAAATGQAVSGVEIEVRLGSGKQAWLLGSAEPLFDAAGACRGAVAAFLDLTERKAAEQGLKMARDELALANDRLEHRVAERTHSLEEKTSELNAFCYSLAHDFRAPLRTQEGFARILVEDYSQKLGKDGSTLAWRVLQAAQRQSDIIQNLLAHISVTRSELSLEPVALKEAVEQARADLALEVIDKKAQIHEEELGQATVLANPSSLHLILLNLLTNAFKFVQRDGSPIVRLRAERRQDYVRLWVEDNGIGISAQDINKLFSMFKRLNADTYPGTGMGLAIVKKATERMGGHVGVESQAGHGSRFWVELKAVTAQSVQ